MEKDSCPKKHGWTEVKINRTTLGKHKHRDTTKLQDYVVQLASENKYWERKFEKYYKKLAKLQNVYEGYLSSLQAVLSVFTQLDPKRDDESVG